jgi:hypothetical protein
LNVSGFIFLRLREAVHSKLQNTPNAHRKVELNIRIPTGNLYLTQLGCPVELDNVELDNVNHSSTLYSHPKIMDKIKSKSGVQGRYLCLGAHPQTPIELNSRS